MTLPSPVRISGLISASEASVSSSLVQALQGLASLGNAGVGHADLAGDVVSVRVGQAGRRVDDQRVDLFRGVGSDFLDVHAAFARGHQGHLLRHAVGHQRNVQFLLDVGAFFDQQAIDLLAFRAGLVRDQLHAEDLVA
jgi:hypothetical protein